MLENVKATVEVRSGDEASHCVWFMAIVFEPSKRVSSSTKVVVSVSLAFEVDNFDGVGVHCKNLGFGNVGQ